MERPATHGFDAMMDELAGRMGYCGTGKTHVTDFIPAEGPVTADQFVEWLILAEEDPVTARFRPELRAIFLRHMKREIVDARDLQWSGAMQGWPALEWKHWRETALHLQLMTQITGKIRIALTPWLNHGWHVPLYVTPRGLTTSPIPSGAGPFEIDFDFRDHVLRVAAASGATRTIPLQPGSVAGFHASVMAALAELGIAVKIATLPNEFPDPVRFPDDHAERPYDRAAVEAFHAALCRVDHAFKAFRTGFLGKASPVHFFWGSFDLAVTRFSGRPAPTHPGGVPGLPDDVTREAYSHEVSSAGFWPGSDAYPHAAFYSYAYPSPEGFADAKVRPEAARFDATLGEFLLDYDDVRTAPDPEAALAAFLQSTYEAAADLAHWDRAALECAPGVPGRPRRVQ
jgi:hypothetical protein